MMRSPLFLFPETTNFWNKGQTEREIEILAIETIRSSSSSPSQVSKPQNPVSKQ
jgi:hypothetical protein